MKNQKSLIIPRLPLESMIDLTYRCNCDCRHCWLWLPENSEAIKQELTLTDIRHLADEARALGCRRWSISGGEPMLRPDFPEIFDYLTGRAVSYTLNTNGTLITPSIARLMRRKGAKLIALYGATAEVHDHITRTPGSFESLQRGFAYLREAGAGFSVQIIPMKDNFHQYKKMIELASAISPSYRVGAPWLYLSASGSQKRNQEIISQRLLPEEVVAFDPPFMGKEELKNARPAKKPGSCSRRTPGKGLFADCINSRRDFHVDPYGSISFCSFIKHPSLRFAWRPGLLPEAWDSFIPSLVDKVVENEEYRENCGSCEKKEDCRSCVVYGYLEHRRFSAPVEYLCAVTDHILRYKEKWSKTHLEYFKIAGLAIRIDSDLPITKKTFAAKFASFHLAKTDRASDVISISHHFQLPDVKRMRLGEKIYHKAPWTIYSKNNSWIYIGIVPNSSSSNFHRIAVFNADHSRGNIYSPDEKNFLEGNLQSLTMFPTDQIWLARVLADRQGFFIHAAGMKIIGQGFLFAGHSEAGKSTTVTMLQDEGEILCDDRIIVRRQPWGFRIYGTWSHGDVPHVSATDAPLRAILFLEKSKINRLVAIDDPQEKLKRLLPLLIKPLVTAAWWELILAVVEKLVREVPAYRLQFDKSGKMTEIIRKLVVDHKNKNKPRRKVRLP